MAADEDVITANLPLLFSEGRPVSLQCLRAEDCQYFISFLMKCVLGDSVQPSQWRSHLRPKWWLPYVPWSSVILSKKYRNEKWTKAFQNLIESCYDAYGNSFLLLFSKRLQQGYEKGWAYRYEANKNGTTTMYHVQTGKILVTFKSENMTYDRGLRENSTVRPALHPRLNTPSPKKIATSSTSAAAVPAGITELPCDVYLCDTCGDGFNSEAAVKVHEAQCSAAEAPETRANTSRANLSKLKSNSDNSSTSSNAGTVEADLEGSTVDQAQFLCGFHLLPRSRAESSSHPVEPSTVPEKKQLKLKPNCTIPFSSSRGQKLSEPFRISVSAARSCINRYETCCQTARSSTAGPASSTGRLSLGSSRCWNVTCRKAPGKRPGEWTHMYSFNKKQRLEQLETMKTGLSARALRLLTRCQRGPCVRMKRLTEAEIRTWTQPKPKPLAQLPLRTYTNGQLQTKKRTTTPVHLGPGIQLTPKASPFTAPAIQILPPDSDPLTLSSRDSELYILPDVLTITPVSRLSQFTLVPVPQPCQIQEEPILIDLCDSSDEEEEKGILITPTTIRARNVRKQQGIFEAELQSPVNQDRSLTSRHPSRPAKGAEPSSVPRDLSVLMQDECKELRHKGLESLIYADESHSPEECQPPRVKSHQPWRETLALPSSRVEADVFPFCTNMF